MSHNTTDSLNAKEVATAETSTRGIRSYYFFAFGVIGCLVPYLSLIFHAKGLSDSEIGSLASIFGIAVIFIPPFWGHVSDQQRDPRWVLAFLLAGSAAGMVLLALVQQMIWVWIAYALYAFFFTAVLPLSNGLVFRVLDKRTDIFNKLRVWGSIGFIVLAAALWAPLSRFGQPVWALYAAGGCCVVSIGLLFRLPSVPVHSQKLPGWHVIKAFRDRNFTLFMLAVFLVNCANSAHYTFTPRYFQALGMDPKWQGLISGFGVFVEVVFMLGLTPMRRLFGMKWLLTLGVAAWGARLLIQGAFPSIAVGILAQILHGPAIGWFLIGSSLYVNDQLPPSLRASAQALLTMIGYGIGKFCGNQAASWLFYSGLTLPQVFEVAGAMALAAAVMLAVFFRVRTEKDHT